MRAVGFVTRIYSLGFHAALSCAMMALAAVAWLSGTPLNIWILPWQGNTLTAVMFFSGLAGALITVLAFKRIVPMLFLLWSAAVAVMLFRGFFFSSYVFGPTSTSITTAALFVLAALVAVLGGLAAVRRVEEPLRRRAAMAMR